MGLVKIVVLICHLSMSKPCTEDTAVAAILADRQDDGTPCMALSRVLLKELRATPAPSDMIRAACQKDGHPYH